jgi:Holliday junction resolvasome RuvABC endonuclease subunit
MNVVGIDVSLVSTGVAVIPAQGQMVTGVITTNGHRGDTLLARTFRQRSILTAFVDYLPPRVELAVIEGPSHGSRGGSAWDRAGLWWAMVRVLIGREIPVAVCAPTTRAKWATGSGKGDKAAVASGVTRITSSTFSTSDEADAAALAWMGAMRLGWRQGPRPSAIDSIDWPDRTAA